MVRLPNFFIISMIVPCGMAAPLLLKWFVSIDVYTGAPFSNWTITPILIPSFPLFPKLTKKVVDYTKTGFNLVSHIDDLHVS